MTAAGLQPNTTYFINEHSTIFPNTAEMFFLNSAILYLYSIYLGRSDTIKIHSSFILLPSLLSLLFNWLQFLLVSGLVIQKQFQQKSHKNVPLVGDPTLDFFHEVRHCKERKVTDAGFWIEVQMGSESSKSPKNEVFRILAKMLSTQIYDFLLQHESVKGLLTFWKNTACLGKIWFLSYDLQTSRPIRMHDSLN